MNNACPVRARSSHSPYQQRKYKAWEMAGFTLHSGCEEHETKAVERKPSSQHEPDFHHGVDMPSLGQPSSTIDLGLGYQAESTVTCWLTRFLKRE